MHNVILLVEDDETQRGFLARYLAGYGFTVLEAENGQVGLATFRTTSVDLVVTDYRMPIMDGGEMLARIFAENPQMRAVLTSGNSFEVEEDPGQRIVRVKKPILDLGLLFQAVVMQIRRQFPGCSEMPFAAT